MLQPIAIVVRRVFDQIVEHRRATARLPFYETTDRTEGYVFHTEPVARRVDARKE